MYLRAWACFDYTEEAFTSVTGFITLIVDKITGVPHAKRSAKGESLSRVQVGLSAHHSSFKLLPNAVLQYGQSLYIVL